MGRPQDYYFSTPLLYEDAGKVPIGVPEVLVFPKKEFISGGYDDCSVEYSDFIDIGLYDFMIDIEDCIFEPNDIHSSCGDIFSRLKSIGLIHNPSLDKYLKKSMEKRSRKIKEHTPETKRNNAA